MLIGINNKCITLYQVFSAPDGNLLQKVHKEKDIVYNYTWSTLGKLTQLDIDEDSMPSKSLMFKYDGLDRRIEKQFVDFKNSKNSYTKRFVYDGEDIILELDGNNTVKALFVHGEGIDDPLMMIRDENDNQIFEDKEVYAYTKDHLGSIREIVDYNGNLMQHYAYSAFGKILKISDGSGNDISASPVVEPYFTYTGREWDAESGLYYYRARYYSPEIGRFISADPHPGDIRSPITLNRYVYARNNGLSYVDPNGEFAFLAGLAIAAAVGGIYAETQGGNFFEGALIGAAAFSAGWVVGPAAAAALGVNGTAAVATSVIFGAAAGGVVGGVGFEQTGIGTFREGFTFGALAGAGGGYAGASNIDGYRIAFNRALRWGGFEAISAPSGWAGWAGYAGYMAIPAATIYNAYACDENDPAQNIFDRTTVCGIDASF